MKSLLVAAVLSFTSIVGAASAATVTPAQMTQNNWIVFDFAPGQGTFQVTPKSADGSFSFSYAFSDDRCPQRWSCMPQTRALNTVHAGPDSGFGYSWNVQSLGGVVNETVLTGAKDSLFLFLRVTSGSASVLQLVADTPANAGPALRPGLTTPVPGLDAPAPVPLPASALLLLGGIGGLAALRRRQKAA